MHTYKIIRFFQEQGRKRQVITRGLTMEEAKEHCHDPETSSSTCTKPYPRSITANCGPWFEGWESE